MLRLLRRRWPKFVAGGLLVLAISPGAFGESLKINSAPAGAVVEINGAVVGTTPFRTDYPGCYFHKPHTVFGERLEHAMVLRISKDGYTLQQLTLTDGPLDWVGLTGKKHGKYFVLRSDHFDLSLEPVAIAVHSSAGHVGPIHPRGTAGFVETGSTVGSIDSGGSGTVVVASEPTGAEIYVDGKFVGQTPATIPLLAGAHRVVVKASGKKDWERELTVLKESQVALHAVLESP
ncbi:MAG TPA: PEGA domain-containing protein [Candidatus Acidoferrales bacterium]